MNIYFRIFGKRIGLYRIAKKFVDRVSKYVSRYV